MGYLVGNIDQKIPHDHYIQLVKISQENNFTVVLERKLNPTKTRERFYVKVEQVNDLLFDSNWQVSKAIAEVLKVLLGK